MTKEEYLLLLDSIDKQSSLDNEFYENVAWLSADSIALENMHQNLNSKEGPVIDITGFTRQHLEDNFDKFNNIMCKNILIRIKKQISSNGSRLKNGVTTVNNFMINILEHKTKTPSGAPCNIYTKVYLSTDSRFKHMRALNRSSYNKDQAIDLIRNIQASMRMSAFV